MPKAFRVLEQLVAAGLPRQEAYGIAEVIAEARELNSVFSGASVRQMLCKNGFSIDIATELSKALSHCFDASRLGTAFKPSALKFALVRAGLQSARADIILGAIEPCVVSAKGNEIRVPLAFAPAAGKVIMCDFTFLQKPEMQKVRRAIVLSRGASNGRTTLVPVSKTPPVVASPFHHRFAPGSYPFFHQADPVWAVCDHIYTVSLARVWKVNVGNKPVFPSISADDLNSVREKVVRAVGQP